MLEVTSVMLNNLAIEYVATRISTTPANMQPAVGVAVLKDENGIKWRLRRYSTPTMC